MKKVETSEETNRETKTRGEEKKEKEKKVRCGNDMVSFTFGLVERSINGEQEKKEKR